MKKHTLDAKHLRCVLIVLALVITIVLVLDSLVVPLSMSQRVSTETFIADTLTETVPPEISTDVPPPLPETSVSSPVPPETTAADSETVTESSPPETAAKPADDGILSLTFLGSCAPGSPLGTTSYGSLNALIQQEGADYFLSKLEPILAADDLTVAANACIFSDSAEITSLSCSAPSTNADIYTAASVEFVTLAAPLGTEKESEALTVTRAALAERGITDAAESTMVYFESDGIRIAVYSPCIVKGDSIDGDLDAIRTASASADYVIVYFWNGGTDTGTPEEWLTYTLHQFADAGASLIVGCGNGSIQPVERYKTSTIAYSLGNLIDGASFRTEAVSAILRLELSRQDDGTISSNITLVPCSASTNRWQPAELPAGDERTQIDAFLAGDSELPLMSK